MSVPSAKLGAFVGMMLLMPAIVVAQTVCFDGPIVQGYTISNCTGACQIYDRCPTRIDCLIGTTFKIRTPSQQGSVECETMSGGSGSCPDCTGGLFQAPSGTFVTIWKQRCSMDCDGGIDPGVAL